MILYSTRVSLLAKSNHVQTLQILLHLITLQNKGRLQPSERGRRSTVSHVGTASSNVIGRCYNCVLISARPAIWVHWMRSRVEILPSRQTLVRVAVRKYRPLCPDQNCFILRIMCQLTISSLSSAFQESPVLIMHPSRLALALVLITLLFSNPIPAGTTAHCYQGQDPDSTIRNDEAQ